MSGRGGAPVQLALPLGEPPTETDSASARMAFLLRLRARGIADVNVLRALEMIPRRLFAPHRFADLALRDIALPIPCGQIMSEPLFVARAMEALALAPEHRVLEIGAGSGYCTAILSRLAREVVTTEYFEALAIESAGRLGRLGIENVSVHQGEGLALAADLGLFDRIIVHAVVDGLPETLAAALAEGGIIILSRLDDQGGGNLSRIAHVAGQGFVESVIGPSRLGRVLGRAA